MATNALLERKGERTAFVVTKGLKVRSRLPKETAMLTSGVGLVTYWQSVETKAL